MENETKKLAKLRFGRSSQAYATSDVHARGESLQVLLDLVRPEPDWRAIDVATGAGHAAIAFAPHVARVIATDITPQMLDTAADLARSKRLSNMETAVADAELMPLNDDSCDLVLCRLAFHHFSQPQTVLSEWRRVLKPGGFLGLTDNFTVEDVAAAEYYNQYEKLRDPSHVCVFPKSGLTMMIEAAGFEIQQIRDLSKEFEFHQWADRQQVSSDDKQRLLAMMQKIPENLQPLFAPRWADGTMYFTLWETVIVARTT